MAAALNFEEVDSDIDVEYSPREADFKFLPVAKLKKKTKTDII